MEVRVRVGIASRDARFAERLKGALEAQFPEDVGCLTFPAADKAAAAAQSGLLDIVLVDMAERERGLTLPDGTGVIYLLEEPEEEADMQGREYTAVCRYRSVDEWYELLTGEYKKIFYSKVQSEKQSSADEHFTGTRICMFTSAAGGTGASSAAAGFAVHCAGLRLPTLYLNAETMQSTDIFFRGTASYTMEDIIYAFRSGRYEPGSIIENALVRDTTGVSFFLSCSRAPDLFSMSGEELVSILEFIKEMNLFSVIVLDMTFDTSEKAVLPFMYADRTVLVTDGSETGNYKTCVFIDTLPMICQADEAAVGRKLRLMYNRFSKDTGCAIKNIGIKKLGGIGEIPVKTSEQLIRSISAMPPSERLAEELGLHV